jgi:hypothetical protein
MALDSQNIFRTNRVNKGLADEHQGEPGSCPNDHKSLRLSALLANGNGQPKHLPDKLAKQIVGAKL